MSEEFDPKAELKKFTTRFKEKIENWMKKYPDTEPIPVGVNPDGTLYWDKKKERAAETRKYLIEQEEKKNESK